MSTERRARTMACRKLRDVDLSALHIFLDFAQHSTRDRWQLGPLIQADLLLLPLGEPVPVLASPATVVWLVREEAALPTTSRYVLPRPLQLESVLALLLRIERHEAEAAAEAAAEAVAAKAVPASVPLRATVAAAGVASVTAPAAPPAPFNPARRPEAQLTFRLNRWPSAGSLAAHRYLPRLASLLSKRHLSVFELSNLSNVTPAECSAFLDDMATEGILDTQLPSELGEDDAVDPTLTQGPLTEPPAGTVPSPASAPGAVSRLRSRLGF